MAATFNERLLKLYIYSKKEPVILMLLQKLLSFFSVSYVMRVCFKNIRPIITMDIPLQTNIEC